MTAKKLEMRRAWSEMYEAGTYAYNSETGQLTRTGVLKTSIAFNANMAADSNANPTSTPGVKL